MNTVALERAENIREKRRLTKKVKRRDVDVQVESVAFQRHRARVLKYLRARYAQGAPSKSRVEDMDDILVFDRLGNRIIYPAAPIDQLARFKKG